MPIIIIVGDEAVEYIQYLERDFQNKYSIDILDCEYIKIRSMLSNQDKNVLYILSGLSKPERYEIYCLARKNEEKFLMISKNLENFVTSDKNKLVLEKYDIKIVDKNLENGRIANTQANKRSKGVSLQGLRGVKNLIKQINLNKYFNDKKIVEILKICEERIIKACAKGLGGDYNGDEIEKCYCQMVDKEMEIKGIKF